MAREEYPPLEEVSATELKFSPPSPGTLPNVLVSFCGSRILVIGGGLDLPAVNSTALALNHTPPSLLTANQAQPVPPSPHSHSHSHPRSDNHTDAAPGAPPASLAEASPPAESVPGHIGAPLLEVPPPSASFPDKAHMGPPLLLRLGLPCSLDPLSAPALDAVLLCSSSALLALPFLRRLPDRPKVFATEAALKLGLLELQELLSLAPPGPTLHGLPSAPTSSDNPTSHNPGSRRLKMGRHHAEGRKGAKGAKGKALLGSSGSAAPHAMSLMEALSQTSRPHTAEQQAGQRQPGQKQAAQELAGQRQTGHQPGQAEHQGTGPQTGQPKGEAAPQGPIPPFMLGKAQRRTVLVPEGEALLGGRDAWVKREWYPMFSARDVAASLDLVTPLRYTEEASLGTGVTVVPLAPGAQDLGACSWLCKGPLGPPWGRELAVVYPRSRGPTLATELDPHLLQGSPDVLLLAAPADRRRGADGGAVQTGAGVGVGAGVGSRVKDAASDVKEEGEGELATRGSGDGAQAVAPVAERGSEATALSVGERGGGEATPDGEKGSEAAADGLSQGAGVAATRSSPLEFDTVGEAVAGALAAWALGKVDPENSDANGTPRAGKRGGKQTGADPAPSPKCQAVLVPLLRPSLAIHTIESIAAHLEVSRINAKVLYVSPLAERTVAVGSSLPEWMGAVARQRLMAGQPLHAAALLQAEGRLVCRGWARAEDKAGKIGKRERGQEGSKKGGGDVERANGGGGGTQGGRVGGEQEPNMDGKAGVPGGSDFAGSVAAQVASLGAPCVVLACHVASCVGPALEILQRWSADASKAVVLSQDESSPYFLDKKALASAPRNASQGQSGIQVVHLRTQAPALDALLASATSGTIMVPQGVEGVEDLRDRCLFYGDASLSLRLPSPCPSSQPGASLAAPPLTVKAAAKGHLPFGARQTKGDARGAPFGSPPAPDTLKGSPPFLGWFEERDGGWVVTRTKKMQEGGEEEAGEEQGAGWKHKRKKGHHEEH